jgi:hypothetical protein
MNHRMNDGTDNPPALRLYMNLSAIETMPQFAGRSSHDLLAIIRDAAFDGIQIYDGAAESTVAACRSLGLGVAQSGRINVPSDAAVVAQRLADGGAECATIHLGWGLEDFEEGVTLIDAMLEASTQYRLPLYAETHRATLFQDMWRTVEFAKHAPDLRFNADFSHWYTGLEMTYGDFDTKLAFVAPVMERVRFMHGRIGDSGCMQVPINEAFSDTRPFVEHFRQMWTLAFRGFLKSAQPGDYIGFSPELLGPEFCYQRMIRSATGTLIEDGNRWKQTILLTNIAKDCFAQAHKENAQWKS